MNKVGKIFGVLVSLAVFYGFWHFVLYPNMPWEPNPDLNPDKNHTHADFRIRIHGTALDFRDDKYMSGLSYDSSSYDDKTEYLHEYLHLHDNVGHVIHRHIPGLDLAEFFESIGMIFTENCLTLDDGESVCSNTTNKWRMFVEGQEITIDPGYIFEDTEKILLTYGSTDKEIRKQIRRLPDDACLYSQACPWRGDPPDEDCIADPSIPCIGGVELEDSLL